MTQEKSSNWNIYLTQPKEEPGTADNIQEDTIQETNNIQEKDIKLWEREQKIMKKPHKKLSLFAVMMVLLVVSVIATAGFLLNKTTHTTTIKEPFVTQAFINSAWITNPDTIATEIFPGETETYYLKVSNNASADLGAIIEITSNNPEIIQETICKPGEKATYRRAGNLIYLKVPALNSSVIGIKTIIPGNATPGLMSWNTTTYRNNLETENYTQNCV
jgi:hypothetical protein